MPLLLSFCFCSQSMIASQRSLVDATFKPLTCRALSTSALKHAAAVTQQAPSFKGQAVIQGDFKEISLQDYAGKYLVLFFYPGICLHSCLLYTSPSPRDKRQSRMPSSA